MSRRKWFQVLILTAVTAFLLVFSPVGLAQGNSGSAFERVREVQERHTQELMARQGVVGTAVGKDERDQPAVLILLEHGAVPGIPAQLEGVSVIRLVTGKIEALQKGGKPGGGSTLKPTSRWPRPVPIGVSTGNMNEASAGTIACRVKDDSGNTYALSNNHVYARENNAALGEEVLQPGRYDGGVAGADHLGNLTTFVSIAFSTSASNTVDAAIARTNGTLGNATPANGYGTPNSTWQAPQLNQSVQKYGRTTSLTKGTITGVNATIDVGYSAGPARFVHQVVVQSKAPFIKAGDSGSLLVTNDQDKYPVGLLFAGNSSGSYAIANNIGDVLTALGALLGSGLSIDGM